MRTTVLQIKYCFIQCACKPSQCAAPMFRHNGVGFWLFTGLQMWRTINLGAVGGVKRPHEAVGGEGLSSLCLYSRSPWEQQRLSNATCSIFNLISKNHASGRSLSCLCVLSVPPLMTKRPVLCAHVEKRIYITSAVSEKKPNPDVRTCRRGGWERREAWDGFNAMPLLDMEVEIITCWHTNRNGPGYFSPCENRVICNVKCWVTAAQGRHVPVWVKSGSDASLMLEVSFQCQKSPSFEWAT